jgi:hypothetical protein
MVYLTKLRFTFFLIASYCFDITITMKRVTELKKCNGTEKL